MRHLVVLAAAVTIAACGSNSPTGPDAIQSLIVVGTPPSVGASSQYRHRQRCGAVCFQGTVATTFSGFTTVNNTEGSDVPIDALLIRLSNSGPACCLPTVNTAGLDSIVLAR